MILKDSSLGLVTAYKSDSEITVKKFINKGPAFQYPYSSEYVDVYLVSQKTKSVSITKYDIKSKCMIYPHYDQYVVLKML